jgi:hypothetical protein
MDKQINARRRQPELFEEDLRHTRIEVLAGMDQDLADPLSGSECSRHRSRLDELRPGANHGKNA